MEFTKEISDAMNAKLTEHDNVSIESGDQIYESSIGQKIIPYIGWWWREVYFHRPFTNGGYELGVLPKYKGSLFAGMTIDHNDTVKVGFMENNKWGYQTLKIDAEQWIHLRTLIYTATQNNRTEDYKAVDDYMQSLLPEDFDTSPDLF